MSTVQNGQALKNICRNASGRTWHLSHHWCCQALEHLKRKPFKVLLVRVGTTWNFEHIPGKWGANESLGLLLKIMRSQGYQGSTKFNWWFEEKVWRPNTDKSMLNEYSFRSGPWHGPSWMSAKSTLSWALTLSGTQELTLLSQYRLSIRICISPSPPVKSVHLGMLEASKCAVVSMCIYIHIYIYVRELDMIL